ncbi:hypothetical protein [Vibrio echinoideorum]|uniref:hypothetical protein n=1 Tax=Vibrio echinoideorum TaxID=2100116 RepID=UPI0010821B88|nr:hypothetical protein [Vibrio echinoideorum]
MKNKNVLYLLPQVDFFKKGMRGRVSHACGFIKGCLENNNKIELVSGYGLERFFDTTRIKYRPANYFLVFYTFWFLFKYGKNYDVVVCRWKPLLSLVFYFARPFLKCDITFEVNSLTSLSWKGRILKELSLFDLRILGSKFHLFLMSNQALKELSTVTGIKESIILSSIVPNGYDQDIFKALDVKNDVKEPISLVYFGTKQSYYDWDFLFSTINKMKKPSLISNLHIFGFDDGNTSDGILFHGKFEQKNLLSKIEKVTNPVLIMHSKNTDMAKSGSPMKLFEYGSLGLPIIIADCMKVKVEDYNSYIPYKASDEGFFSVLLDLNENYENYLNEAKTISFEIAQNESWAAQVANIEL